jgi:hypothetical protein
VLGILESLDHLVIMKSRKANPARQPTPVSEATYYPVCHRNLARWGAEDESVCQRALKSRQLWALQKPPF